MRRTKHPGAFAELSEFTSGTEALLV